MLDVTIDGQPVKVANKNQFRIPVKAGPHLIGCGLRRQAPFRGRG